MHLVGIHKVLSDQIPELLPLVLDLLLKKHVFLPLLLATKKEQDFHALKKTDEVEERTNQSPYFLLPRFSSQPFSSPHA